MTLEPALARMVLIMQGHFKANQDTLSPQHTHTHKSRPFKQDKSIVSQGRNKKEKKKYSSSQFFGERLSKSPFHFPFHSDFNS